MAGGKGTRLRELTRDEVPKPLVPVNGKPVLQHQTERLKENEITEICVVVGHLGEKIINFLGDGSELGVKTIFTDASKAVNFAVASGEDIVNALYKERTSYQPKYEKRYIQESKEAIMSIKKENLAKFMNQIMVGVID
jgi:NDP-sugar pyrophosphorylase family protein